VLELVSEPEWVGMGQREEVGEEMPDPLEELLLQLAQGLRPVPWPMLELVSEPE
jgi:hypothetical protein